MAVRRRGECGLDPSWMDYLITGQTDEARAGNDPAYRETADEIFFFDGADRALIAGLYQRHQSEVVRESARRGVSTPWALRFLEGTVSPSWSIARSTDGGAR